jgi:hypothetical protein
VSLRRPAELFSNSGFHFPKRQFGRNRHVQNFLDCKGFAFVRLRRADWLWLFLLLQLIFGETEPQPPPQEYSCGLGWNGGLNGPDLLSLAFMIPIYVGSIGLVTITFIQTVEALRMCLKGPIEIRELPAAVSVNPHFMENRNWGKTLPVLSRPFLGEFLKGNPPVSASSWGDYALFSGIGAFVFAVLTVVTAGIGIKDRPFFDGYDGCGSVEIYVPPQYEMVAFVNYSLFVVFLGITIVLIGQTRDFLRNSRLAESSTEMAAGQSDH